VYWLALLLLALASWCDLRTRLIPDWIAATMLTMGFLGNMIVYAGGPGDGFLLAAIGCLLGGVIGVCLFGWARLGGGDAKLIAALGTMLGPLSLLQSLFWVAISGGILAILASLRGRRDFAYVPALAIGLLMHGFMADGFWKVIAP